MNLTNEQKNKVKEIINDFDKCMAKDYLGILVEDIKKDELTWDNYDSIVNKLNKGIGRLNDYRGITIMVGLLDNLQKEFGWSEDELVEHWENEIVYMWGGISSSWSNDEPRSIQYLCYDMVDEFVSNLIAA